MMSKNGSKVNKMHVCILVYFMMLNIAARKKKTARPPTSVAESTPVESTDYIENMVRQVSTVLPQVPPTAIRNDLCK